MIARRCVLLWPLLVLGCSDEAAPESFPLPSYSYLTPIRLNVASIEIDDRSPPSPGGSIEALDPVRPIDALKRMAMDRLSADGSAGRAVFVIDQASLARAAGGIDGTLSVHLDVFAGPGGERVGYAEARVVRRRTSSDTGESVRSILYDFTLQMMNDMNVEIEYQIRRSLRDWVQTTDTTAPVPPPVIAQPLSNDQTGGYSVPNAAGQQSAPSTPHTMRAPSSPLTY